MDYNNKKFKAISNSDNGEVSDEMIFHYRQEGNILFCSYEGDEIIRGHLLGVVEDDGQIDMSYHQINRKGEMRTGRCRSRPEQLPDGRLKLYEFWQWTSGDYSEGTSVLEEVK